MISCHENCFLVAFLFEPWQANTAIIVVLTKRPAYACKNLQPTLHFLGQFLGKSLNFREFNSLSVIWVQAETKTRRLYFLVGTYPWQKHNPHALCALTCTGTVSDTFIELIEMWKSKLCQVVVGCALAFPLATRNSSSEPPQVKRGPLLSPSMQQASLKIDKTRHGAEKQMDSTSYQALWWQVFCKSLYTCRKLKKVGLSPYCRKSFDGSVKNKFPGKFFFRSKTSSSVV